MEYHAYIFLRFCASSEKNYWNCLSEDYTCKEYSEKEKNKQTQYLQYYLDVYKSSDIWRVSKN